MASADASSTEARELSLINKVELRIALAESESKLESLLNVYLPPLLLKLGSEHLSVRNKVIGICQHVNTRVKPESIKLPVLALLKQFKDAAQSPLLRHFDLVYIQQGLRRIDQQARCDLFKDVVSGISSNENASPTHAASFFNILLRLLRDFQIPPRGSKEDDNLRTALGVADADARYLANWFAKLLLLRPQSVVSPGLSTKEQDFLTLENKSEVWTATTPTGLSIVDTKHVVVKLLASGLFKDDERLLPVLFASADQNARLAEPAEEIMKRTVANISLDKAATVERLYNIYFGSTSGGQLDPSASTPASVSLRIKILNLLARTTESLKHSEKIISIVEKDLLENTAHALDESKVDRAAEKLRAAIITFLTHAVHRAERSQMEVISDAVIPKLQQFIDGYVQDNMSLEAKGIRGRSFEVIGLLASTNYRTLNDVDFTFTRWLFECLGKEADKDVLVSIDEAVSTILRPMQRTTVVDSQQPLQELLVKNMSLMCRNRRNVVYATLRFANRCLPFGSVRARIINLMGLGESNSSHEVLEEAQKGLDPYWHKMNTDRDVSGQSQEFPDLVELVRDLRLASNENRLASHPLYRKASLEFCRDTLLWKGLEFAKVDIGLAADWKRKLELAATEDLHARAGIRSFLHKIAGNAEGQDILVSLWSSILNSMQSELASERTAAARLGSELCASGPHEMLTFFMPSLTQLGKIVLSNNLEVRLLASQALALLASLPRDTGRPVEIVTTTLAELAAVAAKWPNAIGADINKSHGAIVSLCRYSSRVFLRRGHSAHQDEVVKAKEHLMLALAVLEKATDSTLLDAAVEGLSQLFLACAISPEDVATAMDWDKLLELLLKRARASNERAIICLGNLSLILDEDSHSEKLQQLLDSMHQLHEIRQSETHFTVGEALSTMFCGWESKVLVTSFDIEGAVPTGPQRSMTANKLLQSVLTDCGTTKPSLKKAAVIWLLCFVQYCGHRHEIKDQLQDIQTAFKRCLSDRDELVQESASRGLGLVYECGDQELKQDLVRDLIGSFSSSKADMSGTVTEDTQLFEPGVLPTGDGSITTYKDIMSLASEVGDSSLVYRFMSLASNNAIWSSRAAFGRFGLRNVLSDTNVDEYLATNPKLYPKLYRYRFDPNSNVRKSMNDIWSALVKDSNTTIDKHFDSIMEDLLASIVSGRDWRARQASCAAIADLVQGRKLDRVEPYLNQIWSCCFKVIDDIKDSVRKAAANLARVLSAILIRTLEASDGSSHTAGEALHKVLPFLLSTSGLESSADDVRALSLHTLLEIIKKAKSKTLRPFLSNLIEKLLGMLSTFEPESINYISLNAANYNLKEQDIDNVRLRGVRSSPLMEAVERCLDQLDDAAMAEVAVVLPEIMRSAVGMPTKVGVSRVIVSLCTRRALLVRPHADQLLAALQKRVVDRNDTVSSSYAVSMGYLARGSSDAQILSMLTLSKQLFFDSEDERRQVTAGEIVHAFAKYGSDRFAALASEALPFVFVARHHEDERVREAFKETWDEAVSGSRVASLYLGEIVALIGEQLSSRRWAVKHAAAKATADAVEMVAATQGYVSESEGALIWPVLRLALAEKSWVGKEKVLDGFVKLVDKATQYWSAHAAEAAEAIKIALREARRRNEEYQQHAISALAKVVAIHATNAVQPDEDRGGHALFEAVLEISEAAIERATNTRSSDAMDIDNKSSGEVSSNIRLQTTAAAVDALTSAMLLGLKHLDHDVLEKRTTRTLTLLSAAIQSPAHAVQYAIFDCCQRLLQTLNGQLEADGGASRHKFSNEANGCGAQFERLLFDQRDLILPERVRQRRADAVYSLSQAQMTDGYRTELARLVRTAHGLEKAIGVRATLARAQSHLQ